MEKVVGVVAEYNPFHRGHLFHVEQIRQACPDCAVVAVLSSNFLQRGVPALLDKWERARAAVLCGVDLVLELPLPFCCNNAGVFAAGAVATLKATGLVNAISFGMEDKNELLRTIPDILVHEPPSFKLYLQEFLKKGSSYAEARAQSVEKICPGGGDLLKKPNNTLAIAYAEAVLRQNAAFKLLPIRRRGAGYHDTDTSEMMSAAGIRALLSDGRTDEALAAMPDGTALVLRENLDRGRVCSDLNRFWHYLRFLLARLTPAELSRFAGIGEGMEHRVLDKFSGCASFAELVEAVATRRYPRTRIQRQLCALYLNFSNDDDQTFQKSGPGYIRPLAMNSRGRALLARMRKTATLPVITKPAALRGNDYASHIFALELRGAKLWESLLSAPHWGRELRAVPTLSD